MSFFEKGELKLLWPFYLEAFLATIFYISAPFMVLYFLSIGLPAWQIGIIMAVSPLAAFLFEIPTGAIADLYGRKFSVILGYILAGILYISITWARSFLLILILMFLTSVAFTLTSGSYEAWVVDLLKAKKKNLVSEFFSKRHSLFNLAFIFTGIIGAIVVAKFGLISVWLVSGLSFLLSAILFSFAGEIYKKRKVRIKDSFKDLVKQSKTSISYGFKHNVLFYLFGIMAIWGFLMAMTSSLSITPFLKGFGMQDAWFGYWFSATALFGVLVPLISMKLSKKYSQKTLLMITPIIFLIFGAFALFAFNLVFALILIFFFSIMVDFDTPLSNTYFQKFAPTKIRATLGSVRAMIMALTAAIGTLVAGFVISSIGARYALFLAGLFMIPVIFLYLKIKEKR